MLFRRAASALLPSSFRTSWPSSAARFFSVNADKEFKDRLKASEEQKKKGILNSAKKDFVKKKRAEVNALKKTPEEKIAELDAELKRGEISIKVYNTLAKRHLNEIESNKNLSKEDKARQERRKRKTIEEIMSNCPLPPKEVIAVGKDIAVSLGLIKGTQKLKIRTTPMTGMCTLELGEGFYFQVEAIANAEQFLNEAKAEGREGYGVAAVMASPGMGKTHTLWWACNKMGLKSLYATFNGGMDIVEGDEHGRPVGALACRLMFSGFEFGVNFSAFQTAFYEHPEHDRIQPWAVVEAFREVAKMSNEENLVIAVDELVRIGKSDLNDSVSAYKEITYIINGNRHNRAFVSTLNDKVLSEYILVSSDPNQPADNTGSFRPIKWLRLHPLYQWRKLEVFEKCIEDKNFLWLGALCGGHARSLAALREMIKEKEGLPEAHVAYDVLKNRVLGFVDTKSIPEDVRNDAIMHCVNSMTMELYEKIGIMEVRTLIGNGFVLADNHTSVYVPIKLSMFWLLDWSKGTRTAEMEKVAELIPQLLAHGNDGGVSSADFEHFHARFEVLRRWAMCRANRAKYVTRIKGTGGWYGKETIVSCAPANGNQRKYKESENAKFEIAPPLEGEDWVVPADAESMYPLNQMVIAKEGQAGYDAMMLTTIEGVKSAILYENKYSRGQNIAVDKEGKIMENSIVQKGDGKEVEKKRCVLFKDIESGKGATGAEVFRKLFVEEVWHKCNVLQNGALAEMKNRHGIEAQNVILVVAAMRELEPDFKKKLFMTKDELAAARKQDWSNGSASDQYDRQTVTNLNFQETNDSFLKFPGTVVVLSKQQLKEFYGPTFQEMGIFALAEYGPKFPSST